MEAGVATNQTNESRAIVERFLDGLTRMDLETVIATLHDDMCWEVMGGDFLPHGAVYEGKATWQNELLADAQEQYDLSTWALDAAVVAADGACVVVEWDLAATTSRGRDYRNRYCMVLRVDGGRIKGVREYTDTAHAERVLFGA
jgi:hypothetical protein